jgi:hypothetical protein
MSVARVCATAAPLNAHITTNTPAIHVLNRVIVVVLSESVPVFGMGGSWRSGGGGRHVFLTDRSAGMPNWTDAAASAVDHRGRPLRQKLARPKPTHGRMKR